MVDMEKGRWTDKHRSSALFCKQKEAILSEMDLPIRVKLLSADLHKEGTKLSSDTNITK